MTLLGALILSLFVVLYIAAVAWNIAMEPHPLVSWLVFSALTSIAFCSIGLGVGSLIFGPVTVTSFRVGAWLRSLPISHAIQRQEEEERERQRLRGKPFDFPGD